MKLTQLASTAGLFIVSVFVSTLCLVSSPVYADINTDATAYCNEKYPEYTRKSGEDREVTRNKQQAVRTNRVSCVRGYVDGNGSGTICRNLVRDNIVGQANEERGRTACLDGYNARLAADTAAATPAQSSTPAPAPVSSADNPSANMNLRLGPIPSTGDVNTLKVEPGQEAERTVCGVSGFFGEMLCGLTTFAAKITDASFYMLKIFLEVKPFSTLDDAGNATATYTAWSLFRGIANGFFVIAFLMIIYSHLTSIGLNNYNMKRMLPRLIVGALLVNMSFYLSSLLVDLSNILGTTIVDLMRGVADAAVNEDGVPLKPGSGSFEQSAGLVLLVGAGAAAAGSALLYAGLPVLLPVLASALVALVTTVLILMLRQVLIIVFIILSPLAFAAILLPNTSQYFDKWKSAFIPLLMVFPAISLLYGAGYLASISIQRTAAANGDTILQIMSLGVMVVPLFMIPAVMKLGGGLLNRFGGITNTPGSALRKKAQDRAEKMSNKRDFKALNYDPSKDKSNRLTKKLRGARANAQVNRMGRTASDSRIEKTREIAGTANFRSSIDDTNETLASRAGLTRNPVTKGEALQQTLAQSSDPEQMGKAKNHVLHEKIKAHAKDVEAKAIADRESGATRSDLLAKALAQEGTVTALEKEAAVLQLARSGDMGALLQLVKGSYNMDETQRQTLVSTIRETGAAEKLPFLGNQTSQNNILQGNVSEANFGQTVVAPSVNQDDYSAATYADMDQDGATEVANVLGDALNGNNTLVSQEKLAEHQLAAYTALSNPDTASRVGQGYKDIRRIADKHVSHEEALVMDRLRNMNNRPGDPW